MKRIILTIVVAAFAVALQAGDAKVSQSKGNAAPSCCSKLQTSAECGKLQTSAECGKMKTSIESKEATCPFAKASCCKKKEGKQLTALLSPKAASVK